VNESLLVFIPSGTIMGMAKGASKRQGNNAAFFPMWVWENLDIAVGEEFDFEVEKKSKGIFLAFFKKGK
jgi:recombinational DNA repair protein (RecF pathway)